MDDEDFDEENALRKEIMEEIRNNGGWHPLYRNYGAAEIRSSTSKRDPQRERKESRDGFWNW